MNKISLLPFFLLITATIARAGTIIGNGGDGVRCHASEASPFAGTYSLDYLLEFRNDPNNAPLVGLPSWEHLRDRILNQLTRLSPELASSFRKYNQSLGKNRPINRRLWKETKLEFSDIQDEAITRLLPSNCYTEEGTTRPNIRQAVIRQYNAPNIEYLFDGEILKELNAMHPVQLSFLLVHEWLWDFTQNPQTLRRINWLLHSSKIESLRPEDFDTYLVENRFFDRIQNLCFRSAITRTSLERMLNKACDKVEEKELRLVKQLDFSNTNEDFETGEWSGLFGLQELKLSGIDRILDKLPFHAFLDLFSLEALHLESGGIRELPRWFFQDLSNLKFLNLKNNPIQQITPNFRRLQSLETLELSIGNDFAHASWQHLPASIKTVNLKCHPFSDRSLVKIGTEQLAKVIKVNMDCP